MLHSVGLDVESLLARQSPVQAEELKKGGHGIRDISRARVINLSRRLSRLDCCKKLSQRFRVLFSHKLQHDVGKSLGAL